MKENYKKYAELLLKRCLNIKKNQPLLITAPIETYEFIREVTYKAYELGVTDIYIDWEDEELMHQQLECLEKKTIKNSSYWNKQIYNEYAKKGAAILMLKGTSPNRMNDIDPEILSFVQTNIRNSYQIYREKQLNYEIPWCIAAVSTENYAKEVFPNTPNSLEKLWDAIFEICHVKDDNPNAYWDQKIEQNNQRIKWLENLKIIKLQYENSLGTNLTIGLNPDTKWYGTEKVSKIGPLIVNMPGEEVFTSPLREETSGVVYSAKPLVYGGVTISNFALTFENGQVSRIQAEQGKEVLTNLITQTENANYLGEVALVDYHSPISESQILFYNTLYDENASCHLALGDGFPDTIPEGETMTKEERLKQGLNQSKEHVDFMIGTKDLKITATTQEGEKVIIFERGDFVKIEDNQ